MVINGSKLLEKNPIRFMVDQKVKFFGTTYGLGEAGYDICLAQDVIFTKTMVFRKKVAIRQTAHHSEEFPGWFCLASTLEYFQMPEDMVGIVHDKSTLARKGLSVFNTVIEPGWSGFLTLELVYHGEDQLILTSGMGIAQVIFHQVAEPAQYKGRYQDQPPRPINSIDA